MNSKNYSKGLVSIIMPVFNNLHYTREALLSVFDKTFINYEIIIINNYSSDGTYEFLQHLKDNKDSLPVYCKDFKVINNSENNRFAVANNQGAAISDGEYLLLLNNDTKVTDGWLENMVKVADESPDIAVVGAKLLYGDDSVQHCGVAIGEQKGPVHIFQWFDGDHEAANKRRELSAVTAACVLIRHSVYDEVDGFYEEYVNCFEDVDLCFKVAEKGYRIIYTPDSVVYHYESKTPGRLDKIKYSGKILGERWAHKLVSDIENIYKDEGIYRILKLEGDKIAVSFDFFDKKIESILKDGFSAYNSGDYETAITELTKVYKVQAGVLFDQIYIALAASYEKLGNLEKAKFFYDRSLVATKTLTSVLYAKLFYNRHGLSGLLKIYEDALKNEGDEIAEDVSRYIKDELETKFGYIKGLTSIIIPVFNNLDYTKTAIKYIFDNTSVDYEIVVVNNNSTDGTYEYLENLKNIMRPTNCKNIKVIHNHKNRSFAIANNQGAAISSGEYLMCLNNDTKVQKNWLSAMVECMERYEDCAIVGGRLVYEDYTIQHAGVVVFDDNKNGIMPFHFMQKASFDHPAVIHEREFQCVTAACVLIRHDVFDDVSGYSTDYINCFEDIDLCFKIREIGYRVFYTPNSVVIHYESKTVGRKDKIKYSSEILRNKWNDKISADAWKFYGLYGMSIHLDDERGTLIVDYIDNNMEQMVETAADLYESKEYYKALDILNKIHSLNPCDISPTIGMYMALCYDGIGLYEKALDILQKVDNPNEMVKQLYSVISEKYKK